MGGGRMKSAGTSIAVEPTLCPASQEAKMMLGSMLLEPLCTPEAERIAGVNDLLDPRDRAVFAAAVRHWKAAGNDGQKLAAMVLAEIREHPAVGSAENARSILCDIAESVATAAHVESFAKAVRDAALKRRLVDIATTAARAASNGRTGEEVLADLLADVEDLRRSRDRKSKFPRMTMGELRQNHPERRRPVVEGLIREGETMNIIAAPKVGKSWLVYSLLLSIANNERWLGRFEVTPGKVWLLDNELHPEELRWRLDTVADAMGIPLDVIDRRVVITSLRGNMRSLKDLKEEGIEPGEFKLIVGDACYRFATIDGDENSNTEQTKFYNLVDSIAWEAIAAVGLVHHASKGDQSGKAITDVGAGAGAQSRAADCHLVIRPHEEEGCAVVHAAVRSFAPLQPLALRWAWPLWVADERLDPARLAGRLTKGDQSRQDRDEADKLAIVSKMMKAGQPLSLKGIREATGFGKDKAERLVVALLADGAITKGESVVAHNKCAVYSVAEEGGGMEVHTALIPPSEYVPGGEGGVAPKGGRTPTPHHPGTPHPEFLQFGEGS